MVVKEVLAGDSVHSLLSILDVITVSWTSLFLRVWNVVPGGLSGRQNTYPGQIYVLMFNEHTTG